MINLQNKKYQTARKTGSRWGTFGGELYIANGEIGKVVSVQSKLLVVQVGDLFVFVPKGFSETDPGCDWDLAYAITDPRLRR